jgi:transposase
MIERVFAWLMRSRRLVIRYEHKAENFLAFLELACAIILLKRF